MNGLASKPIFWLSLALGLVTYEAFVIAFICRSRSYTRAQVIAQVALVLLVPVLGAAIVHWFARHGVAPLPQVDRAFEPREVDGA